ncbi:hypothetical protein EW026_g2352 [Hermanssonia centrifuga]|uniref:Vacuolar protein sorting-associated protein 62 n=1 Tax=Hermanssonia centrifuga TaxID=98765 RepID=A0A4S4KPK6_9APHY|nr:hypothetical protein EW026_g2352 [Hermanssonia centrifuga]
MYSTSLFAVFGLAVSTVASTFPFKRNPSAVQPLPDFVLQFAPISHLFSGESQWPADVATHLTHVVPEVNMSKIANSVTMSTISGLASDVFLSSLDPLNSNPSWFGGNGPPDASGLTSAPATIIAVEKPGGIIDAFYFYFYSFDEGTFLGIQAGSHVGDWEHSMVRFTNGVPSFLYLSAHSGGTAYDYSVVPSSGSRAITYIALGTHANYATPGDHPHDFPGLFDQTDAGPIWDVTQNFRGFWFDNSTQTFSLASGANVGGTEEIGEGVGWLEFEGMWGDQQLPLFKDGQLCIDIPDVVDEYCGFRKTSFSFSYDNLDEQETIMPTLNPASLLFIPSPSFTTTSDIPTSTPGGAFGAPSAGESLSPGSIFDGGGGPALVVVFVAIGLLIGAFTALLIVRRMSAGGITFDDYEGQANGLAMWRYYEATEVPLGEEPKLFEMRLEREKGVKEGNERWRGMSVTFICEIYSRRGANFPGRASGDHARLQYKEARSSCTAMVLSNISLPCCSP